MVPDLWDVEIKTDKYHLGFPGGAMIKKIHLSVWEMQVWSLGWKDPLEKEMATDCSTIAWRIPWREEPGGHSPWGHREWDTTEWLSAHTQVATAGQERTIPTFT